MAEYIKQVQERNNFYFVPCDAGEIRQKKYEQKLSPYGATWLFLPVPNLGL